MSISGFQAIHQQELENLTLTTQPFKTLKLFTLAVIQYLKRSALYLLAHGGWLMLFSIIVVAVGMLLVTIAGPHEKHVEEVSEYLRFGLWWVALGVASSIGLDFFEFLSCFLRLAELLLSVAASRQDPVCTLLSYI